MCFAHQIQWDPGHKRGESQDLALYFLFLCREPRHCGAPTARNNRRAGWWLSTDEHLKPVH